MEVLWYRENLPSKAPGNLPSCNQPSKAHDNQPNTLRMLLHVPRLKGQNCVRERSLLYIRHKSLNV